MVDDCCLIDLALSYNTKEKSITSTGSITTFRFSWGWAVSSFSTVFNEILLIHFTTDECFLTLLFVWNLPVVMSGECLQHSKC